MTQRNVEPTQETTTWVQFLEFAEARGLLRDTGLRRNGQIVWVRTEVDLPKDEQLATRDSRQLTRRNLKS